jgi:hypothetical protein
MIRALGLMGLLFFAVGCVTAPRTIIYKKPIQIAAFKPTRINPDPLPSTIAIKTPALQDDRIPIYRGDKLFSYYRLNRDQLTGQFRNALYHALSGSQLFGQTVLAEAPPTNGNVIESTVRLKPWNAGNATVWDHYLSNVGIDYTVKSADGGILKSGTLEQFGTFDQGHFTFSDQERMRFLIEAVQDALAKAAVQISDRLMADSQFLLTARNKNEPFDVSNPPVAPPQDQAFLPTKAQKPIIEIDGIQIIPRQVPAGKLFKVLINFYAENPVTAPSELTVTLNYAILKDGRILKRFEPQKLRVPNGAPETITKKTHASKEKGDYTVVIELELEGETIKQTAQFTIK